MSSQCQKPSISSFWLTTTSAHWLDETAAFMNVCVRLSMALFNVMVSHGGWVEEGVKEGYVMPGKEAPEKGGKLQRQEWGPVITKKRKEREEAIREHRK